MVVGLCETSVGIGVGTKTGADFSGDWLCDIVTIGVCVWLEDTFFVRLKVGVREGV